MDEGKTLRVIIEVRGGVASVEAKDAGFEVYIKDYDTDGSERNTEEVDGEKFIFSEWGVDDVV